MFISRAFAHVGYVVPENTLKTTSGTDFDFLFSTLRNSLDITLILGACVAVIGLYFGLTRSSSFMRWTEKIHNKACSYTELTSWMLRLSLGMALIGAGVAKSLISPLLPNLPAFSFLEIAVGFAFLAGFFLAPAILVAIPLFLLALSKNFYLFGNLDFFAAAVALWILGNPKPGFDDLAGIPFFSPLRKLREYAPLILRIGIGGAMVFLAVYEKFLNPHLSELVVKNYGLGNVIPVSPAMWIFSAGTIELVVSIALIVGWRTRLVSVIAFLVLTLSFFYFKEEVYAHVTLFGVLSVLFITGGGKWSLDEIMNSSPDKNKSNQKENR